MTQKTLLDEFAMAALLALINTPNSALFIVEQAYNLAHLMMQIRKNYETE